MNAIALALAALQAIEQLASGLPQILGIVQQTKTAITAAQAEGRDPTEAEWAALNAQIKSALDQLNAN